MLLREGKAQGARNMVVTHALMAPVLMEVSQMQEAAKLGAFIEFVGGSVTGADAAARLDRSQARRDRRHARVRHGRK